MPLRVPILCAFALVASLAQHAGQSGAGAKFDPNELAEKLAKLNPEQREKLKGMFEPGVLHSLCRVPSECLLDFKWPVCAVSVLSSVLALASAPLAFSRLVVAHCPKRWIG